MRASEHRGRTRWALAVAGAAAFAAQLAACSFPGTGLALSDDDGEPDAGDGDGPDASPPPPDAGEPDGPPPDGAEPGPAGHLLLTEVRAQPDDEEFIEIFNPLDETVSLADYYLSDDPLYGTLPGATGEIPVGNGDAVLQFPGGTLAPGQVAVIAIEEEGFRDRFGTDPDYALVLADEPAAEAMVPVADGSRSMDIIDNGEPIILFRWDGSSDLVTDVDIVVVGNEAPAPGEDNGLPDKSGLSVDGPDPGDAESQYADDAAVTPDMSFRASDAESYQRIAPEGDHESSGGNGVDGHDETSENTLATWAQDGLEPGPGQVAAALR